MHLYLKGITKIAILILLTFSFYSCNQKQEIKHYWVYFNDEYFEKWDTTPILHVDKRYSGDTTKFCYFTARDTITYCLLNLNKDSSFIEFNNNGSNDFDKHIRPFNDTSIILKTDTFNVTKYVQNENLADGSWIFYYTPEFGFFADHSGTWPGLNFLQSSDKIKNLQIKELVKIVIPRFFKNDFNGKSIIE